MTTLLNEFYSNPDNVNKDLLSRELKENSVVLESMPLLDIEQEIIKDKYTEVIEGPEETDNCGICLDGYDTGDQKSKISCRHAYHHQCIVNWYKVKPICPHCKTPFRKCLLADYLESLANNNCDDAV